MAKFRFLPILLFLPALIQAQPRPLQPADYGRWETPHRARLSPDGRWLAVPIERVEGSSELRVFQTGADAPAPLTADQGEDPAFSADSHWLAYSVVPSEKERDKLAKQKKPVRNDAGVIDLATGKARTFEGVSRFEFSEKGAYLALLRYRNDTGKDKPEDKGKDQEKAPRGADLLVLEPSSGKTFSFGSISEFAWQPKGALLALAVDAAGRVGNGVQIFDPASGRLQVLDSGPARFSGLSWREDSADLAFYRSWEKDDREGESQLVDAFRSLDGSADQAVFDPSAAAGFPDDMRVAQAPIQWADDGRCLFFGIQPWRPKEKEGRDSGAESGSNGDAGQKRADADGEGKEDAGEQKPSPVEVWHSEDQRIFPMQELQKERDRRRSLLSVWWLQEGIFHQLGTDLMENARPLQGQAQVAETDGKPYAFANRFDRNRQDVYLIDSREGSRRKAMEGIWYFLGGSSTGRYLLYFSQDRYWVYDSSAGRSRKLADELGGRFVNSEYDTPVRQQDPPWGVAGWLKDDQALLVYDQYDIWSLSPDGSRPPQRLTRGAQEEVVHRYEKLDDEEKFIDPSKPLYLSVYGQWTKRSGFARLEGAFSDSPQVKRLIWRDKQLNRLSQAQDAPVYAFLEQDFDDSPDYWVGGADLADARQATRTNPFQSEFEWGHSELIDYRSRWGKHLQGALHYPAGFREGVRYPMIVYVYERRSRNLHSYVPPSERVPYNATVFTSQGYFVLQPDIAFRDRDPGPSAVDCVVPAVEEALRRAPVDPARVGLVGHSWGGYEASFIPTQTDIFAAAIAGAPLTNFFSMFGTIHWNLGLPETSHFETGQARMEIPYWEDMQAYVRNSPVMFITQLKTPMLVFSGDADGTVDWHQSLELYNYARRAGKELVLLVYPGENHSARRKENQIDYHRRILEWFGHYLKGAPAPAWITQGISALDRERNLKKKQ